MRTNDARVEALRKVPLLAGLSRREVARVLAVSEEVEFLAGATIVEEGNQASDFYLVLEGEARLHVPGKETTVLGPGGYFGEMSVLDGLPRSATIVAKTHVTALRVGRSAFLKVLDTYGTVGRKILVEMSRRLRAAEGSRAGH